MGAWSEMIVKQSKDSLYSILCSSGRQWSIGVTGKIFLLKQNQMTKYREKHNEGKLVLVACRTREQNAERDRMKEKSSWPPAEPDDNIHRDRMKEKSSWLPAEPETKCRERPDEGKIVLIAGRTRWQNAGQRSDEGKIALAACRNQRIKYRERLDEEKSPWLPSEPDDKMQDKYRMM